MEDRSAVHRARIRATFKLAIAPDSELRLLEPRHAPAFYALVEANRDHLAPWVHSPANLHGVLETETKLAANMQAFANGRAIPAGLWHAGALVGEVQLFAINPVEGSSELGYWIARDAEGRGLVTRACHALIGVAFDELGLHRVEIRCMAENARSRRVPERLGFQREGLLRSAQRQHGRFHDVAVYGLLAGDRATDVDDG